MKFQVSGIELEITVSVVLVVLLKHQLIKIATAIMVKLWLIDMIKARFTTTILY